MSSFSGTFSADNQVSNAITLSPGQSVSYSITTAALTGSVVFEKTTKVGKGFATVDTMTATDSGTYANESASDEIVRLRCVEIDDDPGSENVDYVLSDVVDSTSNSAFSRPITNGSTSPYQLSETEAGRPGVFTNDGATEKSYANLPSAKQGLNYEFVVVNENGFRMTAKGDDTIRLSDTVSTAAGYVESVTIGSSIRLFAVNTTQWIATTGPVGTWEVSE